LAGGRCVRLLIFGNTDKNSAGLLRGSRCGFLLLGHYLLDVYGDDDLLSCYRTLRHFGFLRGLWHGVT